MAQKQTTAAGKKKTITHVATVLKDRSDVLDGQRFEDPSFESFLPHIEYLNINSAAAGYVAFDESRTSEGIFPTEGAGRDSYGARRLVALDDTKDLLLKHIPGQTVADKQRKTDLFRKHFGCGWVEAEELASLEQLKAGYIGLRNELEPEPAKGPLKIDDEIPFLDPKETVVVEALVTKPAEATPTADEAAASRLVVSQLENSMVVMIERAMARAPNDTRINAIWKDYERPYAKMSLEAQARMLAAKESALDRCAAVKTKLRAGNGSGREAALAQADAAAALEAAQ
jgi:hypothetical protein